jgi:hypothetical protein
MKYAEGTTTPAETTLGEMRRLLEKAGATHWAHGSAPERDVIQFRIDGRMYKFGVERPDLDTIKAEYIADAVKRGRERQYVIEARADRIDFGTRTGPEWRRRWRARLMWLKAQLEFAEEVPLQTALLSALVLPDGRTFGDWAAPQVEAMYDSGTMPRMLGDGR